MTGCATYLRVYEPLAAFPAAERRRWQQYVAAGAVPDRAAAVARERELALRAALATPPQLVGDVEEHAFVRHEDAVTYICPWRLRLRAWEALEEFRAMLPGDLADAFVPPVVAATAAEAYERWLAENPATRPAIRSATWSVPVPWFLLFDAAERRLSLGGHGAGAPAQTDRALVYLTAMSRARRRAAKALNVVRRTFGEGPATEGIEDLGRWLEEFHPHALVELDYGGLVTLLDDDELASDDSVEALSEALGHLASGRPQQAGDLYEQVTTRWRRIAALEQAN